MVSNTLPIAEALVVVMAATVLGRVIGDAPRTVRKGLLPKRMGETRPPKLPVGVPIPGCRAERLKPAASNGFVDMATPRAVAGVGLSLRADDVLIGEEVKVRELVGDSMKLAAGIADTAKFAAVDIDLWGVEDAVAATVDSLAL